jgi:hypothetical protein
LKKDSVLVLIEAGSGAEAVPVGLSIEWRWDACVAASGAAAIAAHDDVTPVRCVTGDLTRWAGP